MAAEEGSRPRGRPAAPLCFVGRQDDLARLLADLAAGPVVCLHGAAGVGKTALALKAVEVLEGRRTHEVVYVACREGWTLGSCLLAAGHRLDALGCPGASRALGDPDVATADRARHLLDLLAARPMLLVLDDLHELESSFLPRLLARAVERLGGSRLLCVGRAAPAVAEEAAGRVRMVSLEGLRGLATEALRLPDGVPAVEAEALARAAGGRPLAMVLVGKVLEATGLEPRLLRERLERVTSREGAEPEPWLLDELARSLRFDERAVLDHLATFRVPVPSDALGAEDGGGLTSPAGLAALVRRGLVEEGPAGFDMHPLVRELFRARVEGLEALHRRCAVWHRTRAAAPDAGPGRTFDLIEAFHHAYEGDERALALQVLAAAAEPMERSGLAQELLRMIEDCLGGGFDVGLRVYLQRTRLMRRLGRLDEAGAELERLRALDPGSRDRAELFWQKGQLAQDRNDYERALRAYYHALEAARAAADEGAAARILNRLATVSKDRGEYDRAVAFYLQGLRAAEVAGDATERLFAVHNLGRIHYFKGEYVPALELFEKVRAEAAGLGDRDAEALSRNGVAEVLRDRGEYARAGDLYEENARYYRATGNRFGLAFTLSNLGEVETARGRLDRARSQFEEALALQRSLDNPLGQALTLVRLGELWRILGDFERSGASLAEARGFMERVGNRMGLAEVLACQAGLDAARGRWREAEAALQVSLDLRTELSDKRGCAQVVAQRADLHRERGEAQLAERLYDQAFEGFLALEDAVGVACARAGQAAVLRDRGRFDEARSRLDEASEAVERAGDEPLRARLLNERGNLERAAGAYPEALRRYEESLSLRGGLGDRFGQAESLEGIATIRSDQGRYAEAEELFRRSLGIRQALDGSLGHARALDNVGFMAGRRGDVHEAQALHERSLEILAVLGNKREVQKTLGCLATLHLQRGDLAEARVLVEEAYACARELGDRRGMAIALHQSARVALHEGRPERVAVLLESSLALRRELQDERGIVAALGPLADAALRDKDFERAEELYRETLERATRCGFRRDALSARVALAEVAFRKGRRDEAEAEGEALRGELQSMDAPECSARLSRLWGLLAAAEGRPDDARYLLQYARDLYRELSSGPEAARVDDELEALSKDELIARLDRRARILRDLEEAEAAAGPVGTASFGCLLAVRGATAVPESSWLGQGGREAQWFGARGDLWLFEFPHARAALEAAAAVVARVRAGELPEGLTFVCHAGVMDHRCGEPSGPPSTLPLRLAGRVGALEAVLTGPFVEALGARPEGLEDLPPITVRESTEPLALWRLPLTSLP